MIELKLKQNQWSGKKFELKIAYFLLDLVANLIAALNIVGYKISCKSSRWLLTKTPLESSSVGASKQFVDSWLCVREFQIQIRLH